MVDVYGLENRGESVTRTRNSYLDGRIRVAKNFGKVKVRSENYRCRSRSFALRGWHASILVFTPVLYVRTYIWSTVYNQRS